MVDFAEIGMPTSAPEPWPPIPLLVQPPKGIGFCAGCKNWMHAPVGNPPEYGYCGVRRARVVNESADTGEQVVIHQLAITHMTSFCDDWEKRDE